MSMDIDFVEVKRDWCEKKAATYVAGGVSLHLAHSSALREWEMSDLNRVCLAMISLEEAHAAQSRQIRVVEKFVNERPGFVTALQGCSGDDTSDYYRWTGHAESRRQLAEDLHWTNPHHPGDRTEPKPDSAVEATRDE